LPKIVKCFDKSGAESPLSPVV